MSSLPITLGYLQEEKYLFITRAWNESVCADPPKMGWRTHEECLLFST